MAGNAVLHVPVLLQDVLEGLRPEKGGLYVDATLGLGGHARAILEASAPDGRVIGFEWDGEARELARTNLAEFGKRLVLVPNSYACLAEELERLGIMEIHGLVADLGVSSLQLDRRERGFSFMADAPLDMRMDSTRELDAARLIVEVSEEQLADILYYYGEERQARRIARYLAKAQEREAITTTGQLAQLVAQAVPRRFHPEKTHVATRTFQALRIAVNGELDNVRRLLTDAPGFLRAGGRLAIISFHSLDDRLVKQAMQQDERLRPVQKKPVEPQPEEIAVNPRSRSARLRVAERINL